MLKRLVLTVSVALIGAALIVPAAASAHALGSDVTVASKAQYSVLKNTCSNNGGTQGYGKSVIKVEQDEYGKSGVAQFRVRAWGQEQYAGSWHTVDTFSWTYSNFFGNTSGSHYFQFQFTENWDSTHAFEFARLKWRGEWLNASGAVLYYQVLYSKKC